MGSKKSPQPRRPSAPLPDEGAAHVLVVEDDAALARWIGDYLVDHGLRASVATRGDVALELIGSDRPDAVVLDLGLPVLDGLAVCRRAPCVLRRADPDADRAGTTTRTRSAASRRAPTTT